MTDESSLGQMTCHAQKLIGNLCLFLRLSSGMAVMAVETRLRVECLIGPKALVKNRPYFIGVERGMITSETIAACTQTSAYGKQAAM
jgi:hypothetical protein